MNFPNLNVLNRIFARQAELAPTSANNEIVEKKNFKMAHPTRLDEVVLNNTLGLLNLDTLTHETRGSLKGTTEGGTFHLTHGVLKFTGGAAPQQPEEPPVDYPPAEPPADDVDPPSSYDVSQY